MSFPAVLPTDLTAARAVALADDALADTRARLNAVADLFHGTVPPPPWPATPEIIAARKKMRTAREAFASIEKRTPGRTVSAKARETIARLGRDLDVELAKLEHTAATLPRAEDLIPGFNLAGLVAVALALYLLRDHE